MRGLFFPLATFIASCTAGNGAVGFQQFTVPDSGSKPLAVAVWYPSDSAAVSQAIGPFRQTVAVDGRISGERFRLILTSHGSQGSLASHYDTAVALAQEGFVVAALTHTGDNTTDQT